MTQQIKGHTKSSTCFRQKRMLELCRRISWSVPLHTSRPRLVPETSGSVLYDSSAGNLHIPVPTDGSRTTERLQTLNNWSRPPLERQEEREVRLRSLSGATWSVACEWGEFKPDTLLHAWGVGWGPIQSNAFSHSLFSKWGRFSHVQPSLAPQVQPQVETTASGGGCSHTALMEEGWGSTQMEPDLPVNHFSSSCFLCCSHKASRWSARFRAAYQRRGQCSDTLSIIQHF